MNILVLGDGILSKEIVKQTNWTYISKKKNGTDVLNFDKWNSLLMPYDIILNCIANTNTYLNDKESHWNINYKFVSELVDYCNLNNKKIVHISTDYVYTNSIENASESDIPVHGRNWYSYTKLLADAYIELKSNNYLICRGTHKQRPFLYEEAWIDQVGNFDYVDVIASKIIKLIEGDYNGLYNIGTEKKTIYDLAKRTSPYVKIGTKPDKVPRNTSMNLNKFNSILSKEVVISAYNRDYGWIKDLNSDIKVTVYRKGEGELLPGEIKIEKNLGRDVHTFFYHIYNRYDNLSDITYFSQDYFLDHIFNYIEIINSDIDRLSKWAIEKLDNSCWFFNTQFNSKIECFNDGYPHDRGLNLSEVWNDLFNINPPEKFYFTPAGHFAITKDHVRRIDRSVYKKIIDILENRHRGPWEIERLEPYIFINNFMDLKAQ